MCIALVEMHHMDMIGTLIEKLGADPRYWHTSKFYWSGGEVAYGMGKCDKLLLNINAEHAAINGFRRLITESEDPKVRSVLERILDDEEVHLCIFEHLLEEYKCVCPNR